MREFTSAERVASAHRKLLGLADEFDELLTDLVRDPSIGEVIAELILQDSAGGGLRLHIKAEALDQRAVDAALARHAAARGEGAG
jgi:hypothetical protein